MLSASFDAVVQALQLHDRPTVWRAVGYAIALFFVSIPVSIVWHGICRRVIPDMRDHALPGFWVFRVTRPSRWLARVHPASTPSQYLNPRLEPHTLDDLAGHWDVYGFIAIDSASKELLYRGVPLVVAIWIGVDPLGAVLFGTLLWVGTFSLRSIPRSILRGLLFSWLWVSGVWYLAIAIHVTEKYLVHSLLRIRCWQRQGRYPQRRDLYT